MGQQDGLYPGYRRGGHRPGQSLEISVSDGEERGLSLFGGVPVLYRDLRRPGDDRRDVPGTEDRA